MMLLTFRTLIIFLVLCYNSYAQTVITSTSRLSWSQSAVSLPIAQGLNYIVYVDDTTRHSLMDVMCSGAMSPFSCNSKFPPFATSGIHNLQLAAIDVAESPKSNIFQIQVNAPSTPSNLGIVNNIIEPTIFVDNSLISNCLTNYNSVTRLCTNGTKKAYNTIAGALSICTVGDIIAIRGNTYSFAPRISNTIACNGTINNGILIVNYNNENVILKGPYDLDSDSDGFRNWDEDSNLDNKADGPFDTGDRASLIKIVGDYITVKGLTLSWAYSGLIITGSHNFITEIKCEDQWIGCFVLEDGDDNKFYYNAALRDRHASGYFNNVSSNIQEIHNIILYRNFAIKNGRQLPDDSIVMIADGDTAGGGNSDGFTIGKNCSDFHPGELSACLGLIYQENIAWHNTDDCWDTSMARSWLINNLAIDCGPRGRKGFKMLRDQSGMIYSGNIVVGSNPSSSNSIERSFEPRLNDTTSLNTNSFLLHNLGIRSNLQNLFIAGLVDSNRCIVRNNIMFGGAAEYSLFTCIASNNYDGDISGIPNIENAMYDPTSDMILTEECLKDAPHITSIQDCWKISYNKFYNYFKPKIGSSLINSGFLISGYHCPLADDNGELVNTPCRHWTGLTSDQGPFEFGIIGNPDKTKCIELGNC